MLDIYQKCGTNVFLKISSGSNAFKHLSMQGYVYKVSCVYLELMEDNVSFLKIQLKSSVLFRSYTLTLDEFRHTNGVTVSLTFTATVAVAIATVCIIE